MLRITSNASQSITYATSPKFIAETLRRLAEKAHALHSVTITVERVEPMVSAKGRDNTITTPSGDRPR